MKMIPKDWKCPKCGTTNTEWECTKCGHEDDSLTEMIYGVLGIAVDDDPTD